MFSSLTNAAMCTELFATESFEIRKPNLLLEKFSQNDVASVQPNSNTLGNQTAHLECMHSVGGATDDGGGDIHEPTEHIPSNHSRQKSLFNSKANTDDLSKDVSCDTCRQKQSETNENKLVDKHRETFYRVHGNVHENVNILETLFTARFVILRVLLSLSQQWLWTCVCLLFFLSCGSASAVTKSLTPDFVSISKAYNLQKENVSLIKSSDNFAAGQRGMEDQRDMELDLLNPPCFSRDSRSDRRVYSRHPDKCEVFFVCYGNRVWRKACRGSHSVFSVKYQVCVWRNSTLDDCRDGSSSNIDQLHHQSEQNKYRTLSLFENKQSIVAGSKLVIDDFMKRSQKVTHYSYAPSAKKTETSKSLFSFDVNGGKNFTTGGTEAKRTLKRRNRTRSRSKTSRLLFGNATNIRTAQTVATYKQTRNTPLPRTRENETELQIEQESNNSQDNVSRSKAFLQKDLNMNRIRTQEGHNKDSKTSKLHQLATRKKEKGTISLSQARTPALEQGLPESRKRWYSLLSDAPLKLGKSRRKVIPAHIKQLQNRLLVRKSPKRLLTTIKPISLLKKKVYEDSQISTNRLNKKTAYLTNGNRTLNPFSNFALKSNKATDNPFRLHQFLKKIELITRHMESRNTETPTYRIWYSSTHQPRSTLRQPEKKYEPVIEGKYKTLSRNNTFLGLRRLKLPNFKNRTYITQSDLLGKDMNISKQHETSVTKHLRKKFDTRGFRAKGTTQNISLTKNNVRIVEGFKNHRQNTSFLRSGNKTKLFVKEMEGSIHKNISPVPLEKSMNLRNKRFRALKQRWLRTSTTRNPQNPFTKAQGHNVNNNLQYSNFESDQQRVKLDTTSPNFNQVNSYQFERAPNLTTRDQGPLNRSSVHMNSKYPTGQRMTSRTDKEDSRKKIDSIDRYRPLRKSVTATEKSKSRTRDRRLHARKPWNPQKTLELDAVKRKKDTKKKKKTTTSKKQWFLKDIEPRGLKKDEKIQNLFDDLRENKINYSHNLSDRQLYRRFLIERLSQRGVKGSKSVFPRKRSRKILKIDPTYSHRYHLRHQFYNESSNFKIWSNQYPTTKIDQKSWFGRNDLIGRNNFTPKPNSKKDFPDLRSNIILKDEDAVKRNFQKRHPSEYKASEERSDHVAFPRFQFITPRETLLRNRIRLHNLYKNVLSKKSPSQNISWTRKLQKEKRKLPIIHTTVRSDTSISTTTKRRNSTIMLPSITKKRKKKNLKIKDRSQKEQYLPENLRQVKSRRAKLKLILDMWLKQQQNSKLKSEHKASEEKDRITMRPNDTLNLINTTISKTSPSFSPPAATKTPRVQSIGETTLRPTGSDEIPEYRRKLKERCGIMTTPFIIGGRQSRDNQWPWQVSLQVLTSTKPWHRCGGVLVHERWVLTAAHCVEGPYYGDLRNWRAVMAEYDLATISGHERQRSIIRIISHPEYVRTSNFPNDVALLELDKPVDLSAGDVQVACLPDNDLVLRPDAHCWISGWGETRGSGGKEHAMNEVEVSVIDTNACKDMWGRVDIEVLDTQVCVGLGDTGACYGDSGGPLMCAQDGRYHVTGVMSWLISNCSAHNFPNVFSRLDHYMPWVTQQLDYFELFRFQ